MARRNYDTVFKELERLGGGGQGSVYKALHRLDCREYAVKKVRFNKKRKNELLREVQALSDLFHPNIVRYHSSWIEDRDISDDESDQVKFESASSFTQTENEESVEGNSPRDTAGKDSVKGGDNTEGQSGKTSRGANSDGGYDTEEQSDSTSQGTNSEVCILYIQMELCTSTLKDWIEERNKSDGVGGQEEIMDIFRQILLGVEYIHEQGLIHRDLKPQNIFLQKDKENNPVVKIGDFGLAKACISEEEEAQSTAVLNGSRGRYGVGTIPYAAPEMLSGEEYNEKSDIYSLGVIFLEMFHKMPTMMEVVVVAQKLQNGSLPAEFRKKKEWQKQANAVKKMTQKEADRRPSASKLLRGPLFLTQKQEIKMLKERLKKKNALIKNLKERLQKASPYLLQARLKKAKALLKIKSAWIKQLQKRCSDPGLEPHFSAVPRIPLPDIQFQSKKGKDFFSRICKGLSVIYRMFQTDIIYLVYSEVLSYGIEGVQEFRDHPRLKMVIENCFTLAHQLNDDDPDWISKLRKMEQDIMPIALATAGKTRKRRSNRQQRNEDE